MKSKLIAFGFLAVAITFIYFDHWNFKFEMGQLDKKINSLDRQHAFLMLYLGENTIRRDDVFGNGFWQRVACTNLANASEDIRDTEFANDVRKEAHRIVQDYLKYK